MLALVRAGFTVEEMPQNIGTFNVLAWDKGSANGKFSISGGGTPNQGSSPGSTWGYVQYKLSGGGKKENAIQPYMCVYIFKRFS